MDLHDVKISGQYLNDFKIIVDGVELKNVIEVGVKFGTPHEVTVKMLVDVDIDTCAKIDYTQI